MAQKIKGIFLLLLVPGLLLLFYVNPEQATFMPKCIFHLATGWDCPACGTQRALHQLLHLNIKEAIRYNPFLFISLPYLLSLLLVALTSNDKFVRLRYWCYNRYVINIYIILIIGWWIIRNL